MTTEGRFEATASVVPTADTRKYPTILLKIHMYSTVELRHTSTLPVPSNILLSEVLERACKKGKVDSKDYVLRMPDAKTDVQLGQTVDSLNGIAEFCVMKKIVGFSGI